MTPERYAELREQYHAIAPLSGDERAEALAALEQRRPSLAVELADWLEADDAALPDPRRLRDALLEEVGRGADANEPDHPERIGPFTLLNAVGRGSMGHVYEAQQERPQRRVALKLLHTASASERTLQRFEDEIEILGRLEHRNIARIYASGRVTTPAGALRYFAMEWIDGPTLGEWLRATQPPLRERLRVFRGICRGLIEAHARGVVHRDLKPANVLIHPDGDPKLLDFGVSRLHREGPSGRSDRTRAGELLGTLQYMSPEQLAGDPAAVDTRSDVYSAGVVLFEVITGELPRDSSSADLLPALEELARARVRRLVEVQPHLDRDLSVLCAKALELDPAERYGSIQELDADLRRYLGHEPILAKPTGAWRRLVLLSRRHRRAVLACGLGLAVLIGSLFTILRYAKRAERGAERARAAEQRADSNAYRAQVTGAYAALRAGDSAGARSLLAGTRPDLRGWEASWLAGRLDEAEHVLTDHRNQVWDVEFSTDGHTLWTVGGAMVDAPGEQALRAWDVTTGALLATRLLETAELLEIAVHTAGEWIATGGPDEDPTIRLWSTEGCEPLDVLTGHSARIAGLEYVSGGTGLIGVERTGGVVRWSVAPDGTHEPQLRIELAIDDISNVCVEAGRLYCVSGEGPGVVLDVKTLEVLAELPSAGLSVAATGNQVAVGGLAWEGSIDLFEFDDGLQRVGRLDQREPTHSLTWLHDGRVLCSGGASGVLRVWDVEQGRLLSEHAGHERSVQALTADPSGSWLSSGSRDTDARLWRLAEIAPDPSQERRFGALRKISASATGQRVAAADMRLALRLFDGDLEQIASWPADPPTLHTVAVSRDGSRIAHDVGPELVITDASGSVVLGQHATRIHASQWHGASDRIASGSDDGEVAIWDAKAGELLHRWPSAAVRFWGLAFDPTGDRIAVCGDSGTVDVHAMDGQRLQALSGHPETMVFDVAWSPSGRLLASADLEGRVLLWDPDQGELLHEFEPFAGRAIALAFGSDDSRLFAVSSDGALHVLDPVARQELLTVREFNEPPTDIAFSAETGDLWVATAGALQAFRAGGRAWSAAPE